MPRYRVRKVRHAGGGGLEHITHFRVESRKNGKRKTVTKAEVIEDLRTGRNEYDTKVDGAKANVEVVRCPDCVSGDYLRSQPDGSTKDNLLSLPSF